MKYLLVFTQHPQVLIAGSVHRWTWSYGGKCVVAREQVISSTTYSLSCHSYAPVNFHKLYPSLSTNWSRDCGLRRDVWVSWLVDHGRCQMTSLPNSLREEREVSLLLSFTVFTYWKSSKCKKSLLFFIQNRTLNCFVLTNLTWFPCWSRLLLFPTGAPSVIWEFVYGKNRVWNLDEINEVKAIKVVNKV